MSPKMVLDSVLKTLREGKQVPSEGLRPVKPLTEDAAREIRSMRPTLPSTMVAPSRTGMSAIDAAVERYRSK